MTPTLFRIWSQRVFEPEFTSLFNLVFTFAVSPTSFTAATENLLLARPIGYNITMNTPDLSGLPVAEKLRIVTQLWDEIASSSQPISVPPDVIREASRRSTELYADPSMAIDDDELWRRVDG